MSNTSATGGYLTPTSEPLQDVSLDQFLQVFVVGLCGLPGQLVRPRWQPEPPNLPAFGTDWVACGVHSTDRETFGYVKHFGDGDGHEEVWQHEVVNFLCSFYGPNAWNFAGRLAQGIMLSQNREALFLAEMGVVEVTSPIAAPELTKNKWMHRVDETLRVRRKIVRSYSIYNLLSANGTFITDTGLVVPFNVVLPA